MSEIIRKISSKKEELVNLSIFILIVGFVLNGCILLFSKSISITLFNIIDKIILIVEGIIIGLAMFSLLISNPKKLLSIYAIFGSVFLISYILFEKNRMIISKEIIKFFLYNVSTFIMFYFVSKNETLLKNLIKNAKILMVFSCIYLFLVYEHGQYNIWISKYFLIVSIFMNYSFLKYNSKSGLILNIMSVLIMIYTGARTYLLISIIFTLICLGIKFINYFKKETKKKQKYMLIAIAISILVILLIMINYKFVFKQLYYFFYKKLNLNIRIFKLIQQGKFFLSTDRILNIYPAMINSIVKNFWFGNGIYGDRLIVYNELKYNNLLKEGYDISSYYSHNLIIELYSSFGAIIATGIIVYLIYKVYIACKEKRINLDIIICLIAISICPLMLNGTFLDNIFFWALIGVILGQKNIDDKIKLGDIKKNVFFLLDNAFEPDIRVYKEAKYLIGNGYNVEVLCFDKKNKFKDKDIEMYDSIKIKRFFCRTEKTTNLIQKYYIIKKLKVIIYFWWLIKFIYQVKKYLKNKDYNILHCHNLLMAFIGVIFFRDKQIVYDMREYYENNNSKIQNCIIKIMNSYTQNKAKWIVHVNDFQKKKCKEKNHEKLILLPNYQEKELFKNIEKTKSDKIRISYIGKVRDFASLSKLIDNSYKNELIETAIYGNGSEFEKVLNYAKSQNIERIMKGAYNGLKDVKKIYNDTDIIYSVYNTIGKTANNWKNAMPVKSFEAIITLTPIIASKNTVLGDFVEKYDIGFTVNDDSVEEISDLFNKLGNNSKLLQEKIENMKKIQYMFTWEKVSKNLDTIYYKYENT